MKAQKGSIGQDARSMSWSRCAISPMKSLRPSQFVIRAHSSSVASANQMESMDAMTAHRMGLVLAVASKFL